MTLLQSAVNVPGIVGSYHITLGQGGTKLDTSRVEIQVGGHIVEMPNLFPQVTPPYEAVVRIEDGLVAGYKPRTVETFRVSARAAFDAWVGHAISIDQLRELRCSILVDQDEDGRLFNLRVVRDDDEKAQTA